VSFGARVADMRASALGPAGGFIVEALSVGVQPQNPLAYPDRFFEKSRICRQRQA
jgi:hypothetical protein